VNLKILLSTSRIRGKEKPGDFREIWMCAYKYP